MEVPRTGLVLGFEPFAGLPTNPAQAVLPELDGIATGGLTIVARDMPVSLARLPSHLRATVAEHRPAFVLGLGLSAGSPVIRAETLAVNLAHFGVPDNDGAAPTGHRFAPDGPEARVASWDADAVVSAILAEGLPARVSHHAGTHCCNLALFTAIAALADLGARAPCGFLHLPYTPDQVVWLMRQGRASLSAGDPPSMAGLDQARAVKAAIRVMATQAGFA